MLLVLNDPNKSRKSERIQYSYRIVKYVNSSIVGPSAGSLGALDGIILLAGG